jgi:hypothetical protein
VYLPLGLPDRKPLAFRAVKFSAFIFRSPSQFKKLSRQEQRFTKNNSCGLELLCLRHKYRTAGPLKLSELATQFYDYIQQDGGDFTKKFHLHRLSRELAPLARKRTAELNRRRNEAGRDLQTRIDARHLTDEAKKTGIFVNAHSPLLAR